MKWNIGCSGFSYKEWKDVFYPVKLQQREWFVYYCSHFNTLELNVTFYRFPTVAGLQKWYDKSPPGFLFAVKVPKQITHFKQLKDCDKYLDDFYTAIREGLKEKAGPVLFQFPPKFNYTEERLQSIIYNFDASFINVVEFRHSSWWNNDLYSSFIKHNIIFCATSHPDLPDDVIVTGSMAYYRFHGVPTLYYSQYEVPILKKVADELANHHSLKKIFCFFNNTAGVGAIENASWLDKYCISK